MGFVPGKKLIFNWEMVLGFFGVFFVYLQAENTYNIKKKRHTIAFKIYIRSGRLKAQP